MLIRPMEISDIEQVADIEKASFSMPWSPQGFKDAMDMERNILLVAQEGDYILGYVCTYVVLDEGELTNIAVRPDSRGRGIGRMLMEELLKKAVDAGVKTIVLEARVSNTAAIKLYEQMGFRKLGIRKNFYEQPVEDALIMSFTAEEI